MIAELAPAGTPVTARQLAQGLRASLSPSAAKAQLLHSLNAVSGAEHAWPVSSGRAAMTLILTALRKLDRSSQRDEVIIPAYTCYSVPAAVERAGLFPRLCDVDPQSLSIDTDELRRSDFSRVLAVVSCSLYGIPDELPAIESICREQGVYLVDDAAQGMGSRINDRAVGSFGDAGLYSFDKGKAISTMQGGAIIARAGPVAEMLDREVHSLENAAAFHSFALYLQLVAYAIFLRPGLYGMARRVLGRQLGHTTYDTRYPLSTLSTLQGGVAASLMEAVERYNQSRQRVAAQLALACERVAGVSACRPPLGSTPIYTRFPVFVRPSSLRSCALKRLQESRLGASASYPRPLDQVPEVGRRLRGRNGPMTGGQAVASSIITLPTHFYCPPDLPKRIGQALGECLGDATSR